MNSFFILFFNLSSAILKGPKRTVWCWNSKHPNLLVAQRKRIHENFHFKATQLPTDLLQMKKTEKHPRIFWVPAYRKSSGRRRARDAIEQRKGRTIISPFSSFTRDSENFFQIKNRNYPFFLSFSLYLISKSPFISYTIYLDQPK